MLYSLLIVTTLGVACAAPKWHQLSHAYSYEDYLAEFRPHLLANNETAEFFERKEIFEQNFAKIMEHNRKPATWKMGINKFTDRTEAELRKMRGYHKGIGFSAAANSIVPYNRSIDVSALPKHVDWREKSALTPVKDQGGCGSCWTFAAASAVESHVFLKTGKLMELSEQQIASCTENPKHCGGTGGCAGGTAQVAYDSIIKMGGLQSIWTYPYTSYQGEDFKCQFTKTEATVQLASYVQLPHNEYEPLMEAVANVGPIAISVDASNWSMYESGVFDGCNQTNPDVDHAVILAGYGTDAQLGDYWLVKNSWSAAWAENGYIRIKRESTKRCGTDLHPEHGSGCDGGPATVEACGTCAILFDSCYPVIA